MDLVEAVGIDVTAWKASGPANPSFCYQWGFANDDRSRILLCLWYDDCELDADDVVQRGSFRDYIKKIESDGGPKAGRARRVDELLQDAWRLKVPIRVALVEESERKKAAKKEGDPSKPDFRELDPVPWRLTHYDWMTGECVLRRGPGDVALEFDSSERGHSGPAVGAEARAADEVDLPVGDRSEELVEDLIAEIKRTDIPSTTRDTLVQARLGQGSFRAALVKVWDGRCAVTGCTELTVLRASHVKPWRLSDDAERLDSANGLLLTANLDALFDVGLISFTDDGEMLLGDEVEGNSALELGLPAPLRIALSEAQRRYMNFHRAERFLARRRRYLSVEHR
ncbi:HNH endonuclease [Lysobacter capsici]|uniref:HNH endonuclease n=1 Tax=Lysobacter capsici TaxID=435897 RepID=UPI00287B8927|nr:HNH endonuclease [Lysobacter capsici]WND80478.1 HNH endonuclease [Lysobacter capsici]WND85675.1 HNH endonuclease [Lysobacter capsici]